MDFIKKALNKNKASSSQNQGANGQPAQKEDYVDKAFAFATKKAGYNINKETQEKITDGGRAAYEKQTGKKVSANISN